MILTEEETQYIQVDGCFLWRVVQNSDAVVYILAEDEDDMFVQYDDEHNYHDAWTQMDSAERMKIDSLDSEEVQSALAEFI